MSYILNWLMTNWYCARILLMILKVYLLLGIFRN